MKASILGLCAAGALVLMAASPASAQYKTRLIDQVRAQRYGFQRAWFTQVRLDPARSRVANWFLSYDRLYVLTDSTMLHALDANTGRTVWVRQVGHPDYDNLGPAADQHYVTLVNGSTLYVLHRETGRTALAQPLGAAPGAAPTLSEQYVYVPLINGVVEGYPLTEINVSPWFHQSFGRSMVQPLATPDSVFWSTDAGHLYASGGDVPGVRYRFESRTPFASQPSYSDDMIYAISEVGELYAIDESNGHQKWRYATGYPSFRSPAVIGDRVYVTSEEPALHCVDGRTGRAIWKRHGIAQFAAATEQHVYGLGRFGSLEILRRDYGVPVARIPSSGELTAVVNDQSDRLFLISPTGLVQCLYELGAEEPTYYVSPPGQPTGAEAAAEADEEAEPQPAEPSPFAVEREPEAAEPPPANGFGDPFGAEAPADDFAAPFGTPRETPEAAEEPDQPPAEDDPFGGIEDPFGN